MSDDGRVRKLRWRCRRGMKELDVLLERYLTSSVAEIRQRGALRLAAYHHQARAMRDLDKLACAWGAERGPPEAEYATRPGNDLSGKNGLAWLLYQHAGHLVRRDPQTASHVDR